MGTFREWEVIDEEDDPLYQKAKFNGKVLLETEAVNISPFYKIRGTIFITERQFVFEGQEYIENVVEQIMKDQLKIQNQRAKRLARNEAEINDDLPDTQPLLSETESSTSQFPDLAATVPHPSNNAPIIEYEMWSLGQIRIVYPRRYLLRENGLEIWIAGSRKSFFFTFSTNKKRNEALQLICKFSSRFASYKHFFKDISNPSKMLQHYQLVTRWRKRKISNFDYLMELNVLAGRSYNDVTQYPVFPWVLKDYKSLTIDLNDENVYRDLSKPIGALNETRLRTILKRYNDCVLENTELNDLSGTSTTDITIIPPFHYGSHYMSAGIALYYLCRMEPFSTLYVNLHDGRFEMPDRLFHSLENAWELSMTNMGDVKEIIPEIYYFPEFLRNLGKFPLGSRQSGEKVDNIILPPWANDSAENFVRIMRDALESEYVSAHLHQWIDLIFGYKQTGQQAIDACNVFFYLTYAGAVDYNAIQDPLMKAAIEQQIYHFGQTPNQLFTDPHPPRLPFNQCSHLIELCFVRNLIPNKIRNNSKLRSMSTESNGSETNGIIVDGKRIKMPTIDLNDFKFDIEFYNKHFSYSDKPFVISRFEPVEQPSIIHIIRNGQCLKLFDTCERIITFELPMLSKMVYSDPIKSTKLNDIIDTSSSLPNDIPIFNLMPADWSDSIIYQTFAISKNGFYGITAGYLDCSIKVHWLRDGTVLASVTALENGHNDIVTCLSLSNTQDMLITGAKDGSIVHWTSVLKNSKPGRTPLIGKPYRLLSVHFDAVRVIAINMNVGIIVSAADDATIAVYSIARKRFIREIFLDGREANEEKKRDADIMYDMGVEIREVVKIHISDYGYIIIHSIDDTVPYLRSFSINGVLITKMRLHEILFVMKSDASGKILITGGQACSITFRNMFDLEVIEEICVIENQRNKIKDRYTLKKRAQTDRCSIMNAANASTAKKHSKVNSLSIYSAFTPRMKQRHSTAWRAQRFSFANTNLTTIVSDNSANNDNKRPSTSLSTSLHQQRRSILIHQKSFRRSSKINLTPKRMANGSVFADERDSSTPTGTFSYPRASRPRTSRISTHFHGRFSSVNGVAILSESRIIDFDLDPDNTFLICAVLNVKEKKAELLLYPLPNIRHLRKFDEFLVGCKKVLETAKNTIWKTIDEMNDAHYIEQQQYLENGSGSGQMLSDDYNYAQKSSHVSGSYISINVNAKQTKPKKWFQDKVGHSTPHKVKKITNSIASWTSSWIRPATKK